MSTPSRDDLAALYLEQLPFSPYPLQEEALLAWFAGEGGVLVCAPTGTGKTLIAEAAMFEALHTGQTAYYTTPLIALTEQKFAEMQEAAERWGFSRDEVGLVTGNRRVNPDARILVVVAEILLNRLLEHDAFSFADVSAVVMDEFHSFNDRERGIVWELSLGLLPAETRLMLLSATVGNSREFANWLSRCHNRKIELVEGDERRVPLTFQWVGDELLSDQLERMAAGDDESRLTPALVFCFNREHCWSTAELLKGKSLIDKERQKALSNALAMHDWSAGAGPKLKQILQRGVGVHHAGVLPKYRRVVEELFQQRLLTVCVCTETLAAGINLPARSVVLPSLLKGPPGNKKLLDAASAHQMFGRAGRPQFDTRGFVFAMAHEDDVKLARWKEKYDQIPEDTKDPGLLKQKKALKKKMPKRRSTEQYWTEGQFEQIRNASAANLASRGPLPWRLLAHMLELSPEVQPVRELIRKRLLTPKELDRQQKSLDRMLLTLWRAGYVTLDPKPPLDAEGQLESSADDDAPAYRPEFAEPTEELWKLASLRAIHPLFGVFVINHLGIADRNERIQAMESVLELPGSVAHFVRVPGADELPPGPLQTERLDPQLLRFGLATPEELGVVTVAEEEEEDDRRDGFWAEERPRPLRLAEKLQRLYEHEFSASEHIRVNAVWAAGEVLEFGDFNTYVTSKKLQKQEGVIFRHLLRMILLCGEFSQIVPPDTTDEVWHQDLREIARGLARCCHKVDPASTDLALEQAADEARALLQDRAD
ncbi:MAG: DEAD/DEAH box helicase [Planctomycetales bacterium]|nr:DEAD/DEAH box helicase [Planctomycetales bacterium]